MTTTARTNRYAATCQICQTRIPAGAGNLERDIEGVWIVTCTTSCTEPQPTTADEATAAQAAAEIAYLDSLGFNLGDPDQEMHAALIAGGFTNPVSVQLPQPVKPARTLRKPRRKACITGGNCSSHSGRNCGGHDCDAN